jgi:hypothetical protein
MTTIKPATQQPTLPAKPGERVPAKPGDRPRPRLYTAPTCLLDLPQPLLDALHRVAPKRRFPWLTYVLPFVAGIVTYFLYGVVADVVHERMTHALPPGEPAGEAVPSPSPSTDNEQSAHAPPSAPTALAGDEPRSPRAPVDPNRANASTGAHRRTGR